MPLHAWTELSEFRSRPQHTKRTAGRSKWADLPTPWGIAACWGFRATRTRSGAAQPGTAPQTPPAEPARSRGSYSAWANRGSQPGAVGEQLGEGVERVDAPFGGGGQVGVDDREVGESFQGAPAASG